MYYKKGQIVFLHLNLVRLASVHFVKVSYVKHELATNFTHDSDPFINTACLRIIILHYLCIAESCSENETSCSAVPSSKLFANFSLVARSQSGFHVESTTKAACSGIQRKTTPLEGAVYNRSFCCFLLRGGNCPSPDQCLKQKTS